MLTGENAVAAAEFGVLCEEDQCADLSDVEVRLRRLFCIIRSGRFAKEDLADPIIDSLERLPHDVVTVLPQLVMDLALAAEEHSCHALAERFYRVLIASLEIPPHFQANAWFRLGLVTDLQARWRETEDCYRRALQHPGAWPELRDLARFHLANFLMAAESYQGAAHLFAEHADQASNYILPLPALRLREAICRFRAGDVGTAECILLKIRGTPGNEALSPSVEQLLAEIFESRRDFRAAVLCYEKLIQHPCAEVTVKIAALQRLHSIQS
jgi:tetratricopeptide (TPR) repeat protein